jgi:hypothetical protein
VRAKEGMMELGGEGERGDKGWGCSSPFYRGRGSVGEGWPGW